MKPLHVFRLITLVGLLGTARALSAQTQQPVALDVELKNVHLWRGLISFDSPMATVELSYKTEDGAFKMGAWGAFSLGDRHKVTKYYAGYAQSGFALTVSDKPSSYDIFNAHTDHLVYVDVSYTLQNERFPLKMLWSLMVSGRDTYVDKRGKEKNRYSNYVALRMPVWKKENQCVALGIGGAFSFADPSNYYGEHADVTNVFVDYKSAIQVLKYEMPLSIKTVWNPEHQYGALQVAFHLF